MFIFLERGNTLHSSKTYYKDTVKHDPKQTVKNDPNKCEQIISKKAKSKSKERNTFSRSRAIWTSREQGKKENAIERVEKEREI